jgi:hypothetical protein
MTKKHYKVEFGIAGGVKTGSVSFDSSHDSNAIKQADKIGREMGHSRSPYMLWNGSRLVHSREQQY